MCIIIHKKAGVKLKKELYAACFTKNKDGAGFAYVKDKKLIVDKGFFNFESFYEAVSKEEEAEMVIHCRIQTHGGISMENCHPFEWRSKTHPQFHYAIAHNGQLPYPASKTESDTACFVKDVIGPIVDRDPWFFDQDEYRWMMSQAIGLRNKLVIMRYDDKEDKIKTVIIHAKEGTEAHGCWFSNYSYIAYIPAKDWRENLDNEWVYEKEFDPITGQMTEVGHLRKKLGSITQTTLPHLSLLKPQDEDPFYSDFTMSYLDKKQKKKMLALAQEWQKRAYNNFDGYGRNNNLYWLRDDVRDNIKDASEWGLEQVDRWLMMQIEAFPTHKIPPPIAAWMAIDAKEGAAI